MRVITIGASAGGIEALESFFAALPVDTGATYVVVLHLARDFPSQIPAILARKSALPIIAASNGARLLPNTVYVNTPTEDLVIERHVLRAAPRAANNAGHFPIDAVFTSLAVTHGQRAVAIVLSGTGSDGSRGALAVRQAGGVVLAQSPESARFSAMPLALINQGICDEIAAPDQLAAAAARLCARAGPTDEDLAGLRLVIAALERFGSLDASAYKPDFVQRRVLRRMSLSGINDLSHYAEVLADDHERSALVRDLLIGVTRLFRDPVAFARLAEVVREQAGERAEFRAWVAGCATGEEAYSVAITLDEVFADAGRPFRVFATDMNDSAIRHASAGLLEAAALADLSPERCARYFREENGAFRVIPMLRRRLVFSPHDLLRSPRFGDLDLVTCRNLLIYFRPDVRSTVLAKIHESLRPGGLLMLGAGESTAPHDSAFTVVDLPGRLFRKGNQPLKTHAGAATVVVPRATPRPSTTLPLQEAYDRALELMGVCGFLVDEHHQIVHVLGDAGRYLAHPSGRATRSLLELATEGLRPGVGAALLDPGSRHSVEMGGRVLTVASHPLSGSNAELVTIVEAVGAAPPLRTVAEAPVDVAAFRALRYELQRSENEREAASEEFQLATEELVASNEELQSTNEELQAVNEELVTLNGEHKRKIDELFALTSDLENLLATSQDGVLFLDSEGKIRRSTPGLERFLRVAASDQGRYVLDLAPRFQPALSDDDLGIVLGGKTIEREVLLAAGGVALLRLQPYWVAGRAKPEGAVLALTDVTRLAQATRALEMREHLLRQILDSVPGQSAILDETGTILMVNRRWRQFAAENDGDDALVGIGINYITASGANIPVAQGIGDVLGGQRDRYECVYPCHSPTEERWFNLRAERCFPDPVRVLVVHYDVTVERRQERVLEQMREATAVAESRRQFLGVLSHELRTPMTGILALSDLLIKLSPLDEQRAYLRDMKKSASALVNVLNDVLDFAALDAGAVKFEAERVDLRDLVSSVRSLFVGRVDPSRLTLSIESSVGIRVFAPEARLRQILVNFVHNAVKFTESGTIRISALLGGAREAPMLRLAVADTGVGVADDRKQAIFRPFEQGSHQKMRITGGTGLGLAIVADLAARMGGRAWVEDAPVRGSIFSAEVPVRLADGVGVDGVDDSVRVVPLRILVVEDDPLIQVVLERLLAEDGHRAMIAGSLAEARALLGRETFDVAIFDRGLPDGDGVELVREVRARGGLCPFLVAASAAVTPADKAVFAAAGIDAFLDKPFDLVGVRAVLVRAHHARIAAE